MITLWVRDNKTKTNHEHEVCIYPWPLYSRAMFEYALKDAKDELDELYPDGYTISF